LSIAQWSDKEALKRIKDKAQEILDRAYSSGLILEERHRQGERAIHQAQSIEKVDKIIDSLALPEREESSLELMDESQKLLTIMGDNHLSGPSLLKKETRLVTIMGDSKLNYAGLQWQGEMALKVNAIMASVKIKVPPHLEIEWDVTPFMGESRDKRKKGNQGSKQKLKISGIAFMAEVVVLDA